MKSPEWLENKGPTKDSKYDNKCFQYSITLALSYKKIKNKDLRKILKFKRTDMDFTSHQENWKNFEQNNNSVALNVLFVSHNSEEIKLAYKSKYSNKRRHQVILFNDEADKCHYFAVTNLLELYSSERLRSKKAAIINNDNSFQNALDDTLNYQTIERDPQRITKN